MDGFIDGWMDGFIDGWMDGWIDLYMDGREKLLWTDSLSSDGNRIVDILIDKQTDKVLFDKQS